MTENWYAVDDSCIRLAATARKFVIAANQACWVLPDASIKKTMSAGEPPPGQIDGEMIALDGREVSGSVVVVVVVVVDVVVVVVVVVVVEVVVVVVVVVVVDVVVSAGWVVSAG